MTVCLGSMPSDWSSALSSATVTIPNVQWFATEAVDDVGDTAYGTYHTSTAYGVGAVSLTKGGLRAITTVPESKWDAVLWMSVANPWLTWAEAVPISAGAWDLKVWNMQSGQLKTIATSRLLSGQYTFPVINRFFVAWSQATTNTSADIRVFSLADGTSRTLASGRVSPPVFAGQYLVWGQYLGADAEPTFQMVDAATLNPMATPAQLTKPGPVVYLGGSNQFLLWTASGAQMSAYDIQNGVVRTYELGQRDGRHNLEFPMLASHILVWWTGVVETVVDLVTAKGFDVVDGAAADGGNLLVVDGARGTLPTLSSLRLNSTVGIASCG